MFRVREFPPRDPPAEQVSVDFSPFLPHAHSRDGLNGNVVERAWPRTMFTEART